LSLVGPNDSRQIKPNPMEQCLVALGAG